MLVSSDLHPFLKRERSGERGCTTASFSILHPTLFKDFVMSVLSTQDQEKVRLAYRSPHDSMLTKALSETAVPPSPHLEDHRGQYVASSVLPSRALADARYALSAIVRTAEPATIRSNIPSDVVDATVKALLPDGSFQPSTPDVVARLHASVANRRAQRDAMFSELVSVLASYSFRTPS